MEIWIVIEKSTDGEVYIHPFSREDLARNFAKNESEIDAIITVEKHLLNVDNA